MVKKVKKKKIRIIPCLIFLVLIGFFYLIGLFLYNSKIKNIYIFDNELLNDQEIIDLAHLDDYPRFFKYSSNDIKKMVEKSPYVEKARVYKTWFNTIKIHVTEYKILAFDYANDKFILSNGTMIDVDKYDDRGYPTLVNYVSDEVYDKFVNKLSQLEDYIINQISEIKYDPSNYDNGRFLLKMNDGNYIYINISNFLSLNLYNDIYPNFDGHIGVLYLDSGYGDASEYKIIK